MFFLFKIWGCLERTRYGGTPISGNLHMVSFVCVYEAPLSLTHSHEVQAMHLGRGLARPENSVIPATL